MAVTNPQKYNLTAYEGNTFAFLFTFTDDGGSDIDLASDYQDIQFRVFQDGLKATPDIDQTVSGGDLTIQNTNELSGSISASAMDSLEKRNQYYELRFTFSDGSTIEVFLAGRFIVEDATSLDGEAGANLSVTVNQTTNDVTVDAASNSAALAAGFASDAETAKTGAETAESNAQDSANDAEKQAQNTTSFTDSDGNNFSKGAQGYANDASSSASSASTSASNASDDADDAEKQAQNTTSFTDSDGNTFDKGAKGYAEDAATSATNASADAEQAVIDADGYYQKEFTNRHKIEDPLVLPEEDPANIRTPPTGFATLFFDSTNSNALSKKDSSGTTTAI